MAWHATHLDDRTATAAHGEGLREPLLDPAAASPPTTPTTTTTPPAAATWRNGSYPAASTHLPTTSRTVPATAAPPAAVGGGGYVGDDGATQPAAAGGGSPAAGVLLLRPSWAVIALLSVWATADVSARAAALVAALACPAAVPAPALRVLRDLVGWDVGAGAAEGGWRAALGVLLPAALLLAVRAHRCGRGLRSARVGICICLGASAGPEHSYRAYQMSRVAHACEPRHTSPPLSRAVRAPAWGFLHVAAPQLSPPSSPPRFFFMSQSQVLVRRGRRRGLPHGPPKP